MTPFDTGTIAASVALAVPTTQGATRPEEPREARSVVTIDDLAEKFAVDERNFNDDLDVPLNSLAMTTSGCLAVPGLGEIALTEWSRGQFAKVIGVSWDRWFQGAAHQDRADEVNRRLGRASGKVRLRTTSAVPEGLNGQGTVRAVVSEQFSTVPDTMIAAVVRDALVGVEDEVRIIRSSVTDLTTSFLVRVGTPFRPGGPGNVGEVWGGLYVRNSGVGYTRLVVSLFPHRLACKNGMVVPLPGADLVRARHRSLAVSEIRSALLDGLAGIGDRLHRGAQVVGDAANYRVEEVQAEVRGLLREVALPARLFGDVMTAFSREPHASRFGVSQALTLAAQDQAAELRYDLERVAGAYLARR